MSIASYVVMSCLLTWSMLVVASMLRSRGWTPVGMRIAFGNRDDVPEPSPLAARADRAARNMVENLALFVGLVLAASLVATAREQVVLGCQIFFWARVAYAIAYLAGLRYVRTALWLVSLVGLALIAAVAIAG